MRSDDDCRLAFFRRRASGDASRTASKRGTAFAESKADKSCVVFESTTSGHMVMMDEADWVTGILRQAP